MSFKEKPFLIALLSMILSLWTCFYYLRINPQVRRSAKSYNLSPLDASSFSQSQFTSLDSPRQTPFSPKRHPLSQFSLYKDYYGEVARSKSLQSDAGKEFLPRRNVRRQNGKGISEDHPEDLKVSRGSEQNVQLVKSISDRSGNAWNDELDQLVENLLEEVSEELQKIQNASSKRTDAINESLELPEYKLTSGSECSERNVTSTNFRIVGKSLHSLVLFSAYRFSMEEFIVVGLVSVNLRERYGDPVSSCSWYPKGSAYNLRLQNATSSSLDNGTIKMYYVNETSGSEYDTVVCKCSFEDPVGANAEGGFLYFNVTSSSGGFHLVQVLRERPDELLKIQFEGPFRYEYAFCSPPLWGKLHPRYVKEWLMYHHSLWRAKTHYFMYDAGGIDADIANIFQPLVTEGLMTIINITEQRGFQSFYYGQHLAINDCLQRSRFIAKWAFFWDLDEYLQIRPPTTISSIVSQNEGAAWISFGHIVWNKAYCSPEGRLGESGVERMTFRLEYPTCGDRLRSEICHGSEGLRKLAANPRTVFVATVHRTLEPEWNGMVFNTSIARINHYGGLVAYNDESNCAIIKNPDEIDESTILDGWWWKDTSMSQNSKEAFMISQSLQIFNSSFSIHSGKDLTNNDN